MEQIRGLKNELEIKYKETQNIITEKILLDNTRSNFDEFEYEAKIEKLELDLKRSKIILKDAQTRLVLGNDHFGNRKLISQMKNQIEDVENERNSAMKAKKNLEEEMFELQDQLDEITQMKVVTDKKYVETSTENVSLATMVKDNEEELEEIMRKYKASVSALSSQQMTLEAQSETIEIYEDEKIKLKKEIENLHKQLYLECEPLNQSKQNIFLHKIEDLERKLEFEETSRKRKEIVIERLKHNLERFENENEKLTKALKAKGEIQQNCNVQLIKMREDYISLQAKEMDISEKKSILENQLEISEAETMAVKTQLQLANERIEDLHSILNSDTDSDCSSLAFSDGAEDDLDIFLQNHRKRMAEQKEEEIRIRKSIYVEQTESEC